MRRTRLTGHHLSLSEKAAMRSVTLNPHLQGRHSNPPPSQRLLLAGRLAQTSE